MRILATPSDFPRPEVRLFRATREDVRELEACLLASADYFLLTEGAPPKKGAALYLVAEGEADRERRILLVRSREDEKALGLVDLYLHQGEPGVAHLGLLLLLPEARGKGIGRKVVERLVRSLRKDGFFALRASVGDENPEALRFWEGLGFERAGRLEKKVTVLEKWLSPRQGD